MGKCLFAVVNSGGAEGLLICDQEVYIRSILSLTPGNASGGSESPSMTRLDLSCCSQGAGLNSFESVNSMTTWASI
jgi:hypothetical protein